MTALKRKIVRKGPRLKSRSYGKLE